MAHLYSVVVYFNLLYVILAKNLHGDQLSSWMKNI